MCSYSPEKYMGTFAQTLRTFIQKPGCQEKESKSYGIVLIYSMLRSEQQNSQNWN